MNRWGWILGIGVTVGVAWYFWKRQGSNPTTVTAPFSTGPSNVTLSFPVGVEQSNTAASAGAQGINAATTSTASNTGGVSSGGSQSASLPGF